MEEPSVLDYVKSRLFFWRKERVQILSDDVLPEQAQAKDGDLIQPEAASLDPGATNPG